MKTHRDENWTTRIHIMLFSLALIGTVVITLSLSQWLAGQFGQVPACHSDYPQAPRADLSDLMLAAR